MRILLVAENISLRMSGETLLPCCYFEQFVANGEDVYMLCHERVREDLRADLSPDEFDRVRFVTDSALQRLLFRIGRHLPYRVEDLIFNQLIQLVTQWRMRHIARAMVKALNIDVVFQPTPIAAKALSFMLGVGAPVVIGPMSGGMNLPPAFRQMDSAIVRAAIAASRWGSALLHRLFPGKLRATALVVANDQTREALPPGVRGKVFQLMESAVDLDRWQVRPPLVRPADAPVTFIFCARFVDWKGIGLLVRAFAPLARSGGAMLHLVGDGELLEEIKAQVRREELTQHITLHGRLGRDHYQALLRETDVYVTPSLRECGGMAMMEAMAVGLPVIGINWGGVAQYASADCALLVDPTSKEAVVRGLTSAMRRMVQSPLLRQSMGTAARRHLEQARHGWADKADDMLDILAEVAKKKRSPAPVAAPMEPSPAILPIPSIFLRAAN
ncbi:glycosyltransferase family 4 protein [Sphingobium sp. YR768]|uniref:glycosyltransferase family 4 protein n=1 Tax=Sphingobium sp. YR768 TaxID=1884365 RepID=UPI0008CD1A4D|nr:glycosyltransferase family 4 protein [Sphingobium sp. YR768]SER96075.1 Glycosyltransferase involved in cell wall bisynthesis [Sphingobium sp. YR768]